MYVPPLNAVLQVIGCARKDFNSANRIEVPAPFLRLLLQLAIINSNFNETGYLKANPDVAEAVKAGFVESPLLHYIGYGYFEGRLGGTPDVDETWYLRSYPDVRASIKAGDIKSAKDHFELVGAAEGRSPNAEYQPEAFQWKKALVPSG